MKTEEEQLEKFIEKATTEFLEVILKSWEEQTTGFFKDN